MKKRLFTLLLAVVMVLSLFPALSQTAEAYGIYDLWVGGVQVDTANQNDILGDGTARFDSSTNTLWLDDANITTAYTFDTGKNTTAFVYSNGIDLIVRGSAAIGGKANYGIGAANGTLTVNADLNITMSSAGNAYATTAMRCSDDISILGGTMNLTGIASAVYSANGNITISGGRLTLKGGGVYGAIEADGAVTITDGVEYLDATASYGGIVSKANSISIGTGLTVTEPENPVYGKFVYQSDGTTVARHVVITHVYDLWVGGVQVTGLNKDDILGDGGKARFDPATTTLTLDNPTLNGSHGDKYNRDAAIYSELTADLTLEGRGTIGNSKYTFGVYAQSDAEGNGGGLILNGDFNIIEGKYDSVLARGDLTVLGGHLVTGSIYGGENSNINLLGGSIVASGNITAGYDINIGPGIEHLEAVYPGSGSSALLAKGSINIDPSLEIVIPKNPLIKRDGNYTYMYSVSSTGGYSKATRVVITRAYDLWVGGVRVTGANKDDILGDGGKAKYNPDTQELTLNNLTLTGSYPAEGSNAVIYSKMADVILKGKATINAAGHTWGVYAGATSGGYDGELVINGDFTVTGASAYDLLSYGDLTVQGGNLTCGSMRGYNQNVRINGGTVTATDSIQASANIYITNGVKKVDATGAYNALYSVYGTIFLGDELSIIDPDPHVVRDGKVFESDDTTVAKHVVIVNPNCFPLEITQQPTTAYGLVGDTVKFTVKATGYGELHYIWQFSDDWENWTTSSAQTATYSTKLSAGRDGRFVRCIVTDELFNMAISNTACMYVSDLAITQQPEDYSGAVNSTASFTVAAKGGGLTYTWQVSDNNGASWSNSSVTKATYSTKLTAAKDGRLVRCIVQDSHGVKVTSRSASMKIGPTITQQPKDFVGAADASAKFTVAAEGTGLTYQWQYSDDNGATWKTGSVKTATYSTTLTAARDGRMVRCIVTDSKGVSSISKSASMRIGPTITQQPVDYTGAAGSTAKFTVVATGSGLKYQWQISDDNGAGWSNSSVKTAVYSTTLTASRDGRMVRCIVTDSKGVSVISNSASMKVSALKITTQPKDYLGPADSTATFTVAASGTGLSYQWQISSDNGASWSNSSVKTATYSTKLTTAKDGRLVRCIVTDSGGAKAISNTAKMRIYALKITTQPKNYTGAANSTAKFTVVAQGDGLTYQWQYRDNGVTAWTTSSVKTATYTTTLTAARDGRQIRCIVKDSYGNSVTSKTVSMLLQYSPT